MAQVVEEGGLHQVKRKPQLEFAPCVPRRIF